MAAASSSKIIANTNDDTMTGITNIQPVIEKSKKKASQAYNTKYKNGECPICCSKGLIIPCKLCDKTACKECIRRYILDNEKEFPGCMYCSSVFTRETLIDMLGITFVKGLYEEHQEKVRINKQIVLLPTFQPIAERQITIENANKEIKRLNELIQQQRIIIYNTESNKKKEEKKYIRPCSVETCNGFLNTNWKCGICEIITCKDCFIPIINTDVEHVCEAGAKETATLLKKDTKCCPKCGTGIYKIEGCDQIFCTQCHTAFSWKTGQIETGRIHNPHYYQYLRTLAGGNEIRREPGDIPHECACVGNVANVFSTHAAYIYTNTNYIMLEFSTCMKKLFENDKIANVILDKITTVYNISNAFMDLVRYYYHISDIQRTFRRKITDMERQLQDMSVDYLRKKVNKEAFDNTVKMIHRKREIIDERILVVRTLCEVINDITVNLYNTYITNIYTTINNFNAVYKKLAKNRYSLVEINNNMPQYKNYLEMLAEYANPLKEEYVKKQKEIKTIISYCLDEEAKINKSYSSKASLGINATVASHCFMKTL
jgi:hypothetical protein